MDLGTLNFWNLNLVRLVSPLQRIFRYSIHYRSKYHLPDIHNTKPFFFFHFPSLPLSYSYTTQILVSGNNLNRFSLGVCKAGRGLGSGIMNCRSIRSSSRIFSSSIRDPFNMAGLKGQKSPSLELPVRWLMLRAMPEGRGESRELRRGEAGGDSAFPRRRLRKMRRIRKTMAARKMRDPTTETVAVMIVVDFDPELLVSEIVPLVPEELLPFIVPPVPVSEPLPEPLPTLIPA